MKGSAHFAIGAASGFIVSNVIQTDLTTTILFVGLGAVTGLIPDLDINGKLSNKITISYKIIRTVVCIIGFLLMVYSYLDGNETSKWLGVALGVGIILLSSFIKQRHMLTVTGIIVLIAGFSLGKTWLWLLGTFIIAASLVPHRSYTHSIVGILYFGLIAYQFEFSVGIEGAFACCMAGYISHLVADMKMLPFNKRGVKFFLPFSKHEF
ncbi:metal-dependent hydrolase [Niallia endozanthoxylica]|uniref:Metal-dependent hydrolase n=1 Tax=Niallia endozanthoxylica TaxID=2036016 RepID=A0A5J5HM01_9BACI|nr:metal-dependent hydrolase [Niallia endozanthoxylica]KAA9021795.1 metal-dependent hydrolase [Niallia endozanthoxylica]